MALAPTASAQQPSCDEWATATKEFFENANATTVERCLKAGADVHARTELDRYGLGSDTALHVSVQWNEDPAVVAILLEAGADVNARGQTGETPLHDAVRRYIGPFSADDTAARGVTLLLGAGAEVGHILMLSVIAKAQSKAGDRCTDAARSIADFRRALPGAVRTRVERSYFLARIAEAQAQAGRRLPRRSALHIGAIYGRST